MSEPLNPMAGPGHEIGQASPLVPASSRFDLILLALALLLAGILNWRPFVQDYLAFDEHVSFWIADRSSPSSLLTRSFYYSATPPLSFLLQRVSLETFGQHEWALRLPAALCYLGSLIAVWWMGRRWLTPLAGGLAAILLATHPVVQQYAVAGRPYGVGLLLSVLAMHWTAKLTEQRPTRFRWAAWVLINLTLIQTHYLFAALWATQFAWLAWAAISKRLTWRQFVGWWTVLLTLLLSVAPGLYRVWEHRQFLNWTTREPLLSDLWTLVFPVHGSWFRWPVWWGVLAIPILWQIAAHRPRPHEWVDTQQWLRARAFLGGGLIWLFLPAGGLWLVGRYWLQSLAADRYLVIYVPAAALVLAALLCLLHGKVAPTLAAGALAIGWLVPPGEVHPTAGYLARILSARSPEPASIEWKLMAQTIDVSDATRGALYIPNPTAPAYTRLVLVASGLAEMSLVPAYKDDPVFHDYAVCRLGRMYLKGDYPRLSLPMVWSREWSLELKTFYRQAIVRACPRPAASGSRPAGSQGLIWLVAATDTDLLRATADEAESLLKSAGAVEVHRNVSNVRTVVLYRCP